MSPVTDRTVEICHRLAIEARGLSPPEAPAAAELVDKLVSSRLVFRIESGRAEADPPAFTVHPTVRSYVSEPGQQVEREALPNFTLPGFTSGKAHVHPGTPESIRVIREVFDRLHDSAVEAWEAGRQREARFLCRSLFGTMRSRMESNTAARWCRYDEYLQFGLRLANLAKRVSPGLWTYRDRHEIEAIENAEAPLFAEELAWLYNDIGLTLLAEGEMPDTFGVWEQGYEINRVLEGDAEVPRYQLQSQLHLTHTFMELGSIEIAEQYLEETERTNFRVKDPDYEGRIQGYRALIAHLRGSIADADRLYGEAIQSFQSGMRNTRAESFFHRHYAALKIQLGELKEAEQSAQSSRALAQAGHHPDLVAWAQLAWGSLYLARKRLDKATMAYTWALGEARRLGIRRLEAELLSELSRLALSLGDTVVARLRATASLQIANELALGLRQSDALVLVGRATIDAGQRDLGIAYLKHAEILGQRQQYWQRTREAEEHLQRHGATAESE